MIRQRLMAVVAGSALAAGGTAIAAHAALASDSGDNGPQTTTAGPATPQQVTRTIPGVGTVTFTVDPATGVITNVMVMPLTGVTAGTPVVGEKTITIPVTLADGTQQMLSVKVDIEHDHTLVKVEAELRHDPANEAADNEVAEPPEMEAAEAPDPGDAAEAPGVRDTAEHGTDTSSPTTVGEDRGDHHDGTPASVAPTAPPVEDHSGDNQQGGGGGGHDGGGSGGHD